jgi:hypothetical protein
VTNEIFTASTLFTILFHVSNLIAFLAFLLRDQLHLRLLMAVSFFLQGLYYYAIPAGPLYDPLFWKVVSFIANLGMIFLVFGGRFDFGIPADMRELFEKISVLSPGQFRKIVKLSKRISKVGTPVLVEGQKPTELHYLSEGKVRIEKGGQEHIVNAGAFLGEVSFLNDTTASASVHMMEGAVIVSFDAAQLKELMAEDKSIDIAMRGVFNHDLAKKVANSIPMPPPPKPARKR